MLKVAATNKYPHRGGRLAELGDEVAHPLLLGANGYNYYYCELL